MSDIIFEKLLQNTFLPHTAASKAADFFDGHGYHLTYSTVKSAVDNKIILRFIGDLCWKFTFSTDSVHFHERGPFRT